MLVGNDLKKYFIRDISSCLFSMQLQIIHQYVNKLIVLLIFRYCHNEPNIIALTIDAFVQRRRRYLVYRLS